MSARLHLAGVVMLLALSRTALAQSAGAPPKEDAEDVRARHEWEHRRRAFPRSEIPPGARLEALEQLEGLSRRQALSSLATPGTWEPIGPAPIDKGQVHGEGAADPTPYGHARDMSGRVISIAIDPFDARRWFAGTANGGIWQTADGFRGGGPIWTTNTDGAASLAIGALAFDPKRQGVVYAGTGEPEVGHLTVHKGAGLLKSTDGGATWAAKETAFFEGAAFSALRVHPEQTDRLLATTVGGVNAGIVRSTNGGEKFERVQPGTGTDLAVHPAKPSHAYAGLGHHLGDSSNGVYRSDLAGSDPYARWTRIRGPFSDFQGRIGRIALAIAPAKPDRLYVSIQDVADKPVLLGLWYTDNAWEADPTKVTWGEIDTTRTDGRDSKTGEVLRGFCRKQCDFDMELLVDRSDPDLLYAGGIGLWKCASCTKKDSSGASTPTWSDVGTNADPKKAIHVDQHALVQADLPTAGGNAAVFKSIRSDFQWCGIGAVAGGGRKRDEHAENPLTYDLTPPTCDTTVYGRAQGSVTIRVEPTTVSRFTVDPQSGQMTIDPPLNVSLQVGASTVTPGDLGGEVSGRLQVNIYGGDQPCQKEEFKGPLKTGDPANYFVSLTCQVKSLSDLSRSGEPAGTYGFGGGLDVRYFSSPRVVPFFFFFDVLYQVKPPTILFAGNDGGVFSSTDAGGSWENHNTNLAITQFYGGALHPRTGDVALGGSQDNGTERWEGSSRWLHVAGGDGGATAFASSDPKRQALTVWGSQTIRRSLTGATADFENVHDGLDTGNLPFAIQLAKCPGNDDVFLTGTRKVYRTDNFFLDDPVTDPSWRANSPDFALSVSGLAFPPSLAGCSTYVAAAADELKRTVNGGQDWDALAGPSSLYASDLEFDPGNANVLWVSYSGFKISRPRDGQLFRSDNALAEKSQVRWSDKTPAGLNLPINCVLVDPRSKGTVYIGTDIGVLRSTDDGTSWTRMDFQSTRMPNVPVYDLKAGPTGTIVAFTHGRGAFRLVLKKADLSVTKTASPETAGVGQQVAFEIKVRNEGPEEAASVVVTDTLPAGVTFDSVTPAGACEGTGPVICRLGALASGATATITVKVTTRQTGRLTNQVDVTGEVEDPSTSNNQAFASVTVVPGGSDRSIAKSHSPEPVPVNGTITYTLTARNNGPDAATDVVVVDTLPSSVTFVSATASQGSCSGAGASGGGAPPPAPPGARGVGSADLAAAVVTCSLGTLPAGASATITIAGRATQAGNVTNTATVTAREGDPNGANDTATDVARVGGSGGIAITRLTPASARQGTRNLEVRIEGSGFAPGAVVSFQPGAGIEVVPPSAPGFGYVGPTELRQIIHIAADAPATEREVFVSNPGGPSGGLRPFNVFTVTPAAFPAIDLSPATLDFGTLAARQSAQRTLAVRNTGTATLTVRAVGIDGRPMEMVSPAAPFDVPAGGQTTMTLRFAPVAAGTYRRTLVLSSNDPVRPSVTAALNGVATAPLAAKLELTPAALNFGAVGTGQSRGLTVKLKNAGNATLTVSSLSSDSGSFSASLAMPVTLSPGAELSFPVTFTAAARGVASGRLSFASNDPDRPTTTFQARGEGSDPASTDTYSTDDGTIETGVYTDGLVVVNRLTPGRYPATLSRISVFFYPFQGFASPSGATIRLIAYLDPSGGAEPTQRPQILLNQPVTIPSVPANGAFLDFDVAGGPTVTAGDLYVGFAAPNPTGGVIFSADTNGLQRQRGYYSTDGGATFLGPLALQNQTGGLTPANIMIRATTTSGGSASACTWGIAPASFDLPKEGGGGSLGVTAPAGCAWNVTSSSPFITFSGARGPLVAGSGNGTVSFTAAPYTGDGSRTATITAAELDAAVGQSAASSTSSGFTGDVFVPIVLSTAGLGGSFFTSELTLTNRGSTSAVLQARYTPAFGGGGGSAFDVLAPGTQRVFPDGLSYLRSLGTPIPDAGNRGGTVSLSFSGLSSPSAGAATVRTTSSVAEGRAGLAYSGVPASAALTSPVYLLGLRQNASDRSNVALMNAGSSGDVVLRLTVYSGDPATPIVATLPDIGLPPGGFSQVTGILGVSGLSIPNGYVRVERVDGTAPFYAYAVINDQANSDGSFVPPVAAASLAGRSSLTLPVVVETSTFLSELVATNFGSTRKTARLALVADAVAGGSASFTLDLAPGQQLIIPNLFPYLRERGTPGLPPSGTTIVGPVFVTADGGDVSGLFVGARTSSAGGGGRYGLFYPGVPNGAGARQSAWLFGLLQDGENRSNLALVNTGEVDGSTDTFRLEIFDGETGSLRGTVDGVTLGPRRFTQITTLLAVHAPGVRQAYVKVTRTSGSNPFIAYAVVNDGGQPGQRTGDGAFLAMTNVDEPVP